MSRCCICFTVTKFSLSIWWLFIFFYFLLRYEFWKLHSSRMCCRVLLNRLRCRIEPNRACSFFFGTMLLLLLLCCRFSHNWNQQCASRRTNRTDVRTGDERERASERVETVNSKTFEQLESEFQLSAPHNRTARKIFLNWNPIRGLAAAAAPAPTAAASDGRQRQSKCEVRASTTAGILCKPRTGEIKNVFIIFCACKNVLLIYNNKYILIII